MEEINFQAIEKKWQERWEKAETFKVKEDSKKKKCYVLEMFPYPSAVGLHMGHALNYAIGDVFARYKRMKGFNVLYPMGFDAMGLPAENAAIKVGEHPKPFTERAIKNYIRQMKELGLSYDWSKIVSTMEPEYIKWNQYFFLKFLEAGLIYQKKAPVNWCPNCNTVLANEQVQGGKCWRHESTNVEIRHLNQWYIKTTKYADELLDGLKNLNWPEKIKSMQRNWIGRSHGVEIDFEIDNSNKKVVNVKIVPAKTNDAEAIRLIQISGWRENNISPENGVTIDLLEKEKGYMLPPSKKLIESTKKDIKKNQESNYVAKIGENVVGWLGLTFNDKKEISYVVYVHPDYRSMGIGKSLINFIHKKHPDFKFFIKVTSTNQKAIKLYASLGYVKKSEEKYAIGKYFLPLNKMYREELKEQKNKTWPIFTTRPDTIFGVTFMVISAQHEKLMEFVTKEQKTEVKKFLKKVKSVSEKEQADLEKEGVFTGTYAINPATKEKVPVYAGNFVIADYGSGMVMAVPAHDQRDFEFAKKYGIEIKQVIEGKLTDTRAWTESGRLINSSQFKNLENEEAKNKISSWLEKQGKARQVVNYKLRDWGFSRQRYWGTPIPIVYCEKCGIVPIPEKDLPILLPEKVVFGKGNPLEMNKGWIETKCPICNENAKRETETMDTFFDSSWYFLRYPNNKNHSEPFDKDKIKTWLPVDQYIGGAEHACMHLIYSRFFTKALRDLKMLDFDEPFLNLFNQGMLYGEGGIKMSKSKAETCVLPDKVSAKYGMDTARFFLLSLASPDKPRDWSEDGIQGSLRFIRKIFNFYNSLKQGEDPEIVEIELNKTIKNVSEGIENFEYRDALIKLREFLDLLSKQESVSKEILKTSLKLLAPFCPHIAEELWEKLGQKDFISLAEWPEYREVKEKKKQENLNEKIVEQLKSIIEKFPNKKNVYLYVLPFEISRINENLIEKKVGRKTKVFAVNDPKKFDPENKSKKALPGKPGVYLE